MIYFAVATVIFGLIIYLVLGNSESNYGLSILLSSCLFGLIASLFLWFIIGTMCPTEMYISDTYTLRPIDGKYYVESVYDSGIMQYCFMAKGKDGFFVSYHSQEQCIRLDSSPPRVVEYSSRITNKFFRKNFFQTTGRCFYKLYVPKNLVEESADIIVR